MSKITAFIGFQFRINFLISVKVYPECDIKKRISFKKLTRFNIYFLAYFKN